MAIHSPWYCSSTSSQSYVWVWAIESITETANGLHLSASDPRFEAKMTGKLRVGSIWLDVRDANTIRDRQLAEHGGGGALL